jgi:hypothetical protein
MAMEPSILAGAITGIVLFAVLAQRSRSSFRWFLGAYRSNFPSGGRTLYNVESLGDTRRPQDGGGQAGA